jgi:hypothetical protein
MSGLWVSDGAELWQLAIGSGLLFKMGIFESHGSVTAAETVDAAGKILPWDCDERALTR